MLVGQRHPGYVYHVRLSDGRELHVPQGMVREVQA
jgi:hypothetical protein